MMIRMHYVTRSKVYLKEHVASFPYQSLVEWIVESPPLVSFLKRQSSDSNVGICMEESACIADTNC